MGDRHRKRQRPAPTADASGKKRAVAAQKQITLRSLCVQTIGAVFMQRSSDPSHWVPTRRGTFPKKPKSGAAASDCGEDVYGFFARHFVPANRADKFGLPPTAVSFWRSLRSKTEVPCYRLGALAAVPGCAGQQLGLLKIQGGLFAGGVVAEGTFNLFPVTKSKGPQGR